MRTAQPVDVCVIGRTNFATGIGSMAYAACELLSRFYSVSLLPVHSDEVDRSSVLLPSGRKVPVVESARDASVTFFADVLWNGQGDLNYKQVPETGLRVAHLAYDSDVLPPEWVQILNSRFDAAYFSSSHLVAVATRSGVKIPVGWLPIALDLDAALCAPVAEAQKNMVTFGSVASYHPRKGTDTVLRAFIQEFGRDCDARLVLHSNLAFGGFVDYLRELVIASGSENIAMSTAARSRPDMLKLMSGFDVFVNCSMGEGYSIGPREALALGKRLILSDLGAHEDLTGVEGVRTVPTTVMRPGRYPEIDSRVFGSQYAVTVEDAGRFLRETAEHVRLGVESRGAVRRRRLRAAEFSFERLAASYAQVIAPGLKTFRCFEVPTRFGALAPGAELIARRRLTYSRGAIGSVGRATVPAHDAPILNVLNAYVQAMVDCSMRADQPVALPDWNIGRVFGKNARNVRHFRYRGDRSGNLWTSIFAPPFGLLSTDLDDRDFLYGDGASHAGRALPESAGLTGARSRPIRLDERERRLWHSVWASQVRFAPHRQAEVDVTLRGLGGRSIVGISVAPPVSQSAAACDEEAVAIARGAQAWLGARQVDADGVVLVLGSSTGWLAGAMTSRFAEVVALKPSAWTGELGQASEPSDDAPAWLAPVTPPPHSAERAWVAVRDAVLLANSYVLFCVPGDLSTAVEYINPKTTIVDCSSWAFCSSPPHES